MTPIERQLSAQFGEIDVDGSAWAEHKAMPFVAKWFPELSVRAGNILFRVRGIRTFGDFLRLDVGTLLRTRNSGAKTCKEVMVLRDKVFAEGPEKWIERQREEDVANVVRLPQEALAGLSVRTRNVLEKNGIDTYDRLFALDEKEILRLKAAGRKTAAEIREFQVACGIGESQPAVPVAPQICPVDPHAFKSLPEFLLATMEKVRLPKDERMRRALGDQMGCFNVEDHETLEACSAKLDLTRERVRQIGMKIKRRLFEDGRGYFATFADAVESVLCDNGWILASRDFSRKVDEMLGWKGTTGYSLAQVMTFLGHSVDMDAAGVCIGEFNAHFKSRYEAFLSHVNGPIPRLFDLSFENFSQTAGKIGLAGCSELEYGHFVRRGMTRRIVVRHVGRKRVVESSVDIKPLRVRRYFSYEFKLSEDEPTQGLGLLRREAVLEVLTAAGYAGLTESEIAEQCAHDYPNFGWSPNSVRAMVFSGNALDESDTVIIGYDRGHATGGRTRYSLTSFFKDAKTIRILKQAGRELRNYMEDSGFGIVSVWKVWRKYKDQLPLPLPKLGFYMMLRETKAAGLNYPDYPRVVHPDAECCEASYNWELYQYFMLAGHETATYQQIFDFYTECLCLDPIIANACAIPSLGLQSNVDLAEGVFAIPMPKRKSADYPGVLLPNVKIDPELSFSKPRRRGLHMTSGDFDEHGHARTATVYVRLFFYNLQESGYAFTSDEWAELTDAGWCAEHFGIHSSIVVPLSRSPKPPANSYWIEPFEFGGVRAWVSDNWNAKRKARFDIWAMRIAARAGMDFEPYGL